MLTHPHYFNTTLSPVQMVNLVDSIVHFLNDSKSISLSLNYLFSNPCLQINSNPLLLILDGSGLFIPGDWEAECGFINTNTLLHECKNVCCGHDNT